MVPGLCAPLSVDDFLTVSVLLLPWLPKPIIELVPVSLIWVMKIHSLVEQAATTDLIS